MVWGLALLLVSIGVGCDGSDRLDSCAACNATNSTCRLVSGIFTRPQMSMGYNMITQLPQSACNLNISELKQSRNYLALRRADGTFVLNGNWAINWSGDFESKGAHFTYTRDDDHHTESIYSPGPLMEALDLMVIYQQPNPGIKYQYQIPMVRPEVGVKLSAIAPPLIRHTAFLNVIPEDHKRLEKIKDIKPSRPTVPGTEALYPGDEAVKPKPKRKRKFAWRITGFSECSKSCGGGIQNAILACVREYNHLTVSDRRCAAIDKPSPQSVRCNLKPCVAEWVGGEWSECSVTCGEGVQTREILCRQEISTTLIMTVAEGACLTPPSPMLHRIRTCQEPPCLLPHEPNSSPTPLDDQWEVSLWTECSSTCGLGSRTRSVSCPSNTCSLSDRPASESICDMGPCQSGSHGKAEVTAGQPTWFFTEWTQQCSEGCGTGVQTRKVYCSSGNTQKCSIESRPESSRACSSDKLCGSQWFSGPWGQCSVSCGWGRQSRSVLCIAKAQGHFTILSDDLCSTPDKPDLEQPCQVVPCGHEWYTADWSQCSRSCENGMQRREVRCLTEHQEPSDLCQEDDKPPSRRVCNTHMCSNTAENSVSKTKRITVKHPATTADPTSGTLQTSQNDNDSPHDQLLDSPSEGEECRDEFHNCLLVVQARLCKYKYYRNSCCKTCHKSQPTKHTPINNHLSV